MAMGNFQEKASAISTSKRRGNLFKKASELSTLCGASVAIVTISEKGKLSIFPNSDAVIQRYLRGKKGSSKGSNNMQRKQSKTGAKKQAVVEAAAGEAEAEMTQPRDQVLNVAAEEGVGAISVVDPITDPHKQFDSKLLKLS